MDGSTFEPLRFSPSRSYFSLLFFPHFSQFAQSFQPLLFSSASTYLTRWLRNNLSRLMRSSSLVRVLFMHEPRGI